MCPFKNFTGDSILCRRERESADIGIEVLQEGMVIFYYKMDPQVANDYNVKPMERVISLILKSC